MKIARVHLENGATHTLCMPFTTEDEAREICLSGLENITGLPRERLVRITRVEVVEVETLGNPLFSQTQISEIKMPAGDGKSGNQPD